MQKKSVNDSQLSREQQVMEKLWEEHLASEFKYKNAEAAIKTMVDRPSVNHVPVMAGGLGRKQLTHFYDRYFIPQMPSGPAFLKLSGERISSPCCLSRTSSITSSCTCVH